MFVVCETDYSISITGVCVVQITTKESHQSACVYLSLFLLLAHTHTHTLTEMPDPFAKIVVDGSGQCHCTDVVKSTLDPKWNQHYDL